jgi:Protein of unknown function (DUF4232)
MIKALAVAIALAALLAACGGGAKEAGPVPTAKKSHSSVTAGGSGTASGSTGTGTPAPSLCEDDSTTVEVDSQRGAAGTIMTTWRVKNTSASACRSFGYPGMDFHAATGGWLGVEVHRGGVDIINQTPASVVLDPGQSLYFVSLWGDVDTQAGPCTQFDRIKVTLPDNFASARVDSKGCVDPGLVRVGPVTDAPPS